MANVLIEEKTMQDIANSIREKSGTTVKMKPAEMPKTIKEMEVVDTGIGSRQWWLDVCKEKTTFSYMFSDLARETIPPIDTSNGINFSYMFYKSLITTIPPINTSNGINFSYMFYKSLITTIPPINTSNGTDFSHMFRHCSNLTTIPPINTSNGTNFSYMFGNCKKLISVPTLDVSKSRNFNNMFGYCEALQDISFVKECIHKKINFWFCTKLTDESIQSIIDGLADLTGQTAQKLTVPRSSLSKLTPEQLTQISNKNWNVSDIL